MVDIAFGTVFERDIFVVSNDVFRVVQLISISAAKDSPDLLI